MPRKATRHSFGFKVRTNDGETRIIKAKAKMIKARKPVTLVLTAEDVESSIKQGGVGNTQTCSMAICAKRLAHAFPHPVDGYIDWTYSRAYVVTKVRNGLPIECVAYTHYDDIAKINDSKNGQKKLLADLKANGPRTVRLFPAPATARRETGRPRGKDDGSRTKIASSYGAKRRFAQALLGGVAA